jgi:ketosteroid isomerase-like protein
MSTADFPQIVERYHEALDVFVTGDPEPVKNLFSRGDDVTLANPLGPPARGWNAVAEAGDRAGSQIREGEPLHFERISEYVTADLAYIVEFERGRAKFGGAEVSAKYALRVTTIFRREDAGWRILHRHADPITTPRPVESIFE